MNAMLFDEAAPDSRKALKDAIDAYLAETGMAPSAFGRKALDNYPSFVARLRGCADVRMDTADKVLGWLGKPQIGPRFRAGLEAHMGVTGTKPYLLGEQALGDPSFVTRLLGGGSAMLSTVDAVRAWVVADADEAALRAMDDSAAKAADAAKPMAEERTDMTSQ